MKFVDEGQKRLHDEGIFANNLDKPYSFFSDQILSYIQTPQIKKDLFEIIIKEGIEEIPEHLFLKYYGIKKDDILTALRIAREFDVDITLDHVTEGHLIVDHLVKAGKPVLVGPSFGSKTKVELREKRIRNR